MLGVEPEMIGGCCVCSDERGWDENPLVYCDGDGCTVAVHQACYGIVSVPSGPWFCRKCESHVAHESARCSFCPSGDGALKRTDKNTWAHVICALYIPEVRFGNVSTMEPIILGLVPQERYQKSCYLCEIRGGEDAAKVAVSGACMSCNKTGCKQSFHVTCAQSAGLLCEEAGNYMDNVKYCGYCEYHYQRINKKIVKTIPAYKQPRCVIQHPKKSNSSSQNEKKKCVDNSLGSTSRKSSLEEETKKLKRRGSADDESAFGKSSSNDTLKSSSNHHHRSLNHSKYPVSNSSAAGEVDSSKFESYKSSQYNSNEVHQSRSLNPVNLSTTSILPQDPHHNPRQKNTTPPVDAEGNNSPRDFSTNKPSQSPNISCSSVTAADSSSTIPTTNKVVLKFSKQDNGQYSTTPPPPVVSLPVPMSHCTTSSNHSTTTMTNNHQQISGSSSKATSVGCSIPLEKLHQNSRVDQQQSHPVRSSVPTPPSSSNKSITSPPTEIETNNSTNKSLMIKDETTTTMEESDESTNDLQIDFDQPSASEYNRDVSTSDEDSSQSKEIHDTRQPAFVDSVDGAPNNSHSNKETVITGAESEFKKKQDELSVNVQENLSKIANENISTSSHPSTKKAKNGGGRLQVSTSSQLNRTTTTAEKIGSSSVSEMPQKKGTHVAQPSTSIVTLLPRKLPSEERRVIHSSKETPRTHEDHKESPSIISKDADISPDSQVIKFPSESSSTRDVVSPCWMMGATLNPDSEMCEELKTCLDNEIQIKKEALEHDRENDVDCSPNVLHGVPITSSSRSVDPLTQLLQSQWRLSSDFFMEQAAHCGFAEKLSALNDLKSDNAKLFDSIAELNAQRDQLQAIKSRLTSLVMSKGPRGDERSGSMSSGGSPASSTSSSNVNNSTPSPLKRHSVVTNTSTVTSFDTTIVPIP